MLYIYIYNLICSTSRSCVSKIKRRVCLQDRAYVTTLFYFVCIGLHKRKFPEILLIRHVFCWVFVDPLDASKTQDQYIYKLDHCQYDIYEALMATSKLIWWSNRILHGIFVLSYDFCHHQLCVWSINRTTSKNMYKK